MASGRGGSIEPGATIARARATSASAPASATLRDEDAQPEIAARNANIPAGHKQRTDAFGIERQAIIAAVATPPIYADRASGKTFSDPFAMVDDYLARLGLPPLDESGYTMARQGSANVAVNVLDEHGVLLVLAPVMAVPKEGRETFYRRLLELSFLSTADAAFAIDAARDLVFVRALRRLSGLEFEEFDVLLGAVGRVADEWDDVLKREFGG
jgi:hypothetical protein